MRQQKLTTAGIGELLSTTGDLCLRGGVDGSGVFSRTSSSSASDSTCFTFSFPLLCFLFEMASLGLEISVIAPVLGLDCGVDFGRLGFALGLTEGGGEGGGDRELSCS